MGIDSASGLIDRDGFATRLTAVREHTCTQGDGAVLLVHVDHFNACLQGYAGRTASVVRKLCDLVTASAAATGHAAHFGGADFGVVLGAGAGHVAADVARRLASQIATTDFGTPGKALRLTASIGVTPITGAPPPSVPAIMSAAEAATRAARDGGGGRAVCMSPNHPAAIGNLLSVRMLPVVREALRLGHLELYCQPIVPLRPAAHALQAAEILVRLATVDRGLLQPEDFLPVVERFHLTSVIDQQVIERSCRWLESRAESWVDLDYVTVNLHARSLTDGELTKWIVERIQRGHFDPRHFCLEVTESAAIQNMERARDFLTRLRDMGCHVALDDFGAGYSSLAHFQSLPVDIVKLDGGFMGRIVEDAAARELVSWVCDLCRSSDRHTVAEHCSTPEILEIVRSLGVDYAQGHAVCEPFPLDNLLPDSSPAPTLLHRAGGPKQPFQSPRNSRYAGLSVSSV